MSVLLKHTGLSVSEMDQSRLKKKSPYNCYLCRSNGRSANVIHNTLIIVRQEYRSYNGSSCKLTINRQRKITREECKQIISKPFPSQLTFVFSITICAASKIQQ